MEKPSQQAITLYMYRIIILLLFTSLTFIPIFAAEEGGTEGVSIDPENLSGGVVHSEGFYLPKGLDIPAELRTPIDTRISNVGDIVTVQTMNDLLIGDYNVIPAQSFLHGSISRVSRPGKAFKNAQVEVDFNRISIKGDGTSPSRNVYITGKLALKEFASKSHGVNDGPVFGSRSKKAAAIGGLVGGGATGLSFGLTGLYEGFGTSGMMVARGATLLGAGLGALAGVSLVQKDDLRIDPGTAVTINLNESSFDTSGKKHDYQELEYKHAAEYISESAEEAYDRIGNGMYSQKL